MIQKIIPSLGRKSNAQRNFSIVLILISIVGSILFGIYLDGYGLHPPKQYTGLCPPPYHIGKTCTESVVQTITQGSTTKETVIQVPAGRVFIENASTTVTVTSTSVVVIK